MAQHKNFIVFQCYGNEGIFYECANALLSLSRLYRAPQLANLQIWIYTDNPGFFQAFKDCPLPLYYKEIKNEIIAKWRGDINFVHRVKIEVLRDFAKDRTGNILYVDTDIVFTRSIDELWDKIGEGKLYMHLPEGTVSSRSNKIFAKLDGYLQKSKQNMPLREVVMWNAGVLGFNTQYKLLLDDILAFTDREYPLFPKHIIEQFAFSIYFQKAGEIQAASSYILHYWDLKEARQVLASFFARFKGSSWEELTNYSGMIQMDALLKEKREFLQNRSIIARVLKKKWAPETPEWHTAT